MGGNTGCFFAGFANKNILAENKAKFGWAMQYQFGRSAAPQPDYSRKPVNPVCIQLILIIVFDVL